LLDAVAFPVPAKGAIIGKLKKHAVTMTHSNCSGTHATLTPGHITDTSTYGVHLALKSLDECANAKSQYGWKELQNGQKISTFDYEFELKQ